MSTFTRTWSAEISRVGSFIPVRLFEVHHMDKERSLTCGAFCSLNAIMTPLFDLPCQLSAWWKLMESLIYITNI